MGRLSEGNADSVATAQKPDEGSSVATLRELDPERLSSVRNSVFLLLDLGVPTEALQPVRDWLSARQEAANELHQRHMRMCGITTLAGHKYGWGNCPDFICRHCGSPPDADGDHSCPCPYRDEECPHDHHAA